ncbi:HAD superfamily hydrolase [Mycena sanguinolenta]|nr:HAD superfamily hydrolase [Mycena sanguinolenta]
MPPITTLLFDCDNTLVLSETLAFEACAELANEILESQGISDRYTGHALFTEFVGQNFRGMMSSLQKKYSLDLPPSTFDAYVTREEDQVIGKIKTSLQPCVGADAEVARLVALGRFELAVVSSSAGRRVEASLDKVGMDKYFPRNRIFSAATSLEKPTSKPDPAIYLHACKVMGKQPGECVAIEDSKNGTLSAVRAGIHTVGYVGSYEGPEQQNEMKRVLKEAGADPIMVDWSEFGACLERIEKSS